LVSKAAPVAAVTETATTPPPLPPNTRRQVIGLVDSSASSTSSRKVQALEAQTKAQQILTQNSSIDFEWVDSAHPAQWQRRDELLLACPRTADTSWPQFFVVDVPIGSSNTAAVPAHKRPPVTFWGSWPDFERSFQAGTLVEDLQREPAVALVKPPPPHVVPATVAVTDTSVSAAGADNDDDDDDEEGEDDDNEEDGEDEDEEEENDKFDAEPGPPMTKEEREFLNNSQGILFFEEEDTAPTKSKSSAMQTASNSASFDAMMEAEGDNTDLSNQLGHKSFQQSQADQMNSSQAMLSLHSAADASHKRHVSPKLDQYASPLQWEGALVGVSIAGFDIGTSQGPIADADWYSDKTTELTKMAQFNGAPGRDVTRRKLVLPEMVFPIAHVALEGHGIWLSWDAADCLQAWAKSHASIAVRSTAEHNGVSVLKSKDAALWDSQRKRQEGIVDDVSAVFHYDWTFSTPFSVKTEGGEWVELDESGMRMDLLTDQSVSILFFDEIVLYEDDLHDNGQVQYSIKLRIMPTCAYVLARLFVRVDHVIVRVRETRILVDFFGIQPQVYRDVTWRECAWEDLGEHGLPTTVTAWTCSEGNGSNSPEAVEWHNLIQRLPKVSLPEGVMPYAVLEYGVSLVSMGESGSMVL
jgi:TIP41-like family